jgi:hypothetical protein
MAHGCEMPAGGMGIGRVCQEGRSAEDPADLHNGFLVAFGPPAFEARLPRPLGAQRSFRFVTALRHPSDRLPLLIKKALGAHPLRSFWTGDHPHEEIRRVERLRDCLQAGQ